MSEEKTDWSLTTFDGARREQLRRWAQLPLEDIVRALEEMDELTKEIGGTMPSDTALGGTLERRDDGWNWRDGIREPRVRDMLLNELTPNFRCTQHAGGTHVEIPHDWDALKYWPAGQQDPDAANAIRELVQSSAAIEAPSYAEGLAEMLDDHRLAKHGWLVPIEQWDAVMRELIGCWWEKRDEEEILARARALGWEK